MLVVEEIVGGTVRVEEMGDGREMVDEGDKFSSPATVSISNVGDTTNVGPGDPSSNGADDGLADRIPECDETLVTVPVS